MRCDFCDEALPDTDPENLALLGHLSVRAPCNEQYGFLLENLRASWTPSMSGG